jgi:hypothetical protein
VGIYLAVNSAGRKDPLVLEDEITDAFIDRYFPTRAPPPAEPTAPTALEHARMMQGLYETSRRSQSSFVSIVYMLLQQVQVKAEPDGTIVVLNAAFEGPDGSPKHWREVAPFVWRAAGDQQRLAAKVDHGRVVMFGLDGSAAELVYQPVPLVRSSAWNVPLFAGALAVLLVTTAGWPIGAIARRLLKARSSLPGRARWVRQGAKAAAALGIAYVAAWAMLFGTMLNDLSIVNAGLDPWLRALQALGLAITAGAAVAVWNLWLSFRRGRSWASRIGALLLAAACLDLVWVSFAFHLVSASLSY